MTLEMSSHESHEYQGSSKHFSKVAKSKAEPVRHFPIRKRIQIVGIDTADLSKIQTIVNGHVYLKLFHFAQFRAVVKFVLLLIPNIYTSQHQGRSQTQIWGFYLFFINYGSIFMHFRLL